MEQKKIIIANWKMNLNLASGSGLVKELLASINDWKSPDLEVVICPDFLSLTPLAEQLKDKGIFLGAQDCFWEKTGAYTGEVSPQFLSELGCKYVLVGHSERREHKQETNAQINLKVKAALGNGLIPVICVGETFSERQDGNKDFVIMTQTAAALAGVKLLSTDQLIIAYEPVWVIGSGQAVDPEEAEHAHRVIKQVLFDHFSSTVLNEQIRIIYGGSVKPSNIKSFMIQPTIDGVLAGGSSLEAVSFMDLIKQAKF
ncbi:MAG: triose-phosphate isomerase [Patescibacteria group bacterium]|jgi:triosephosphate isomerase